ncbi:MAG: AraC family transcriptional regulator [Acidimicrobiales bacterium]
MTSNQAKPGPDGVFPCQPALLELFDELTDVLFCIKDEQSRYVFVNDGFLRRSGRRSKRDLIGRRASDIFAPQRAELYESQDRQVLDSGVALRDLLELIRRPDGSTGWYLTAKIPVDNGHQPGGLVSISKDLETPSDEVLAMESLTRVIDYVHDHLAEPMRASDLVRVAGCSASQLTARMKRATGLTPTQFIVRSRVDRASELLATTNVPIAHVASEAGFYDQANLTRQFGRYTGLTPTSYRATRGSAIR